MSHPDKIYPIDFAGFFELKDQPYYEGKSLLNIEDYPAAKEFADEICRRWNCHGDLLEALETACNFIEVFSAKHKGYLGKDWENAMSAGVKEMKSAIKKARGL